MNTLKKITKTLFIVFSIGILNFSCKDNTNYYLEELKVLDAYMAEHYPKAEKTPSGMYYIEQVEGTGERAAVGMRVEVLYKGTLLDGTVFDQKLDPEDPFSFIIGYGEVISGWDEGVSYMKDGGKAILVIPSTLGYGSAGKDPIPAYASLIFEIELVNVQ